MALVKTDLLGTASGSGHGTGTFVTSSFTPPDNSLLVVAIEAMENSGTTDPSSDISVSGGGLTFTSRAILGLAPSWSLGTRIFTAPVTTGASMTLTLDLAARNADHFTVNVVAFTGYDTSSPIGATASGSNTAPAAGGGAFSMNLSAAPAASSYVVAILACDHDSAGSTPGSTYTEIYDQLVGSVGGSEFQFRTGSTSTTVDWVDVNSGAGSIFKFAALAIEIKEAPATLDSSLQIGPLPPDAFVGPTGAISFSSTLDFYNLGAELQEPEDPDQAGDNGPKGSPSGVAFVGPLSDMPFKSTWDFFYDSEISTDTNVTAADAAVSVVVNDNDAIIAPNAGTVTATVVSNDPDPGIKPNAGTVIASVVSNDIDPALGANAGVATATVVSNNPSSSVKANAGTVTVSVTANSPSGNTQPTAGAVTATVVASNATESIQVNAGAANVAVTVNNPSISILKDVGTTTASVVASGPTGGVSPNADVAVVNASATDVTAVVLENHSPVTFISPVSFGITNQRINGTWDFFAEDTFIQPAIGNAPAEQASATVVANNASVVIESNSGTVSVAVTGNNSTANVKPNSGVATVATTANNSSAVVNPNSGAVVAGVTSNNSASSLATNSGTTGATVSANSSSGIVAPTPATTSVTATANSSSTFITVNAGTASVGVTANSPTPNVLVNAETVTVAVTVDNPSATGVVDIFTIATLGPGPRPFVPNSFVRSTFDYFTDRIYITQTVATPTDAVVTAFDATVEVDVSSGNSTATVTANAPVASVKANSTAIAVSATSNQPSIDVKVSAGAATATVVATNVATPVNAGTATVTVAANNAVATVKPSAGTTTALTFAQGTTGSLSVSGGATTASVVVIDNVVDVRVTGDSAAVVVEVFAPGTKPVAIIDAPIIIIRDPQPDNIITIIDQSRVVIRTEDTDLTIKNASDVFIIRD